MQHTYINVYILILILALTVNALPPFICPSLKPRFPAPSDVTDLSPADIKVVMAMGDSISAGFAMACSKKVRLLMVVSIQTFLLMGLLNTVETFSASVAIRIR